MVKFLVLGWFTAAIYIYFFRLRSFTAAIYIYFFRLRSVKINAKNPTSAAGMIHELSMIPIWIKSVEKCVVTTNCMILRDVEMPPLLQPVSLLNNTICFRHTVVIFLCITHGRHPIARPIERCMDPNLIIAIAVLCALAHHIEPRYIESR